MIAAALATGEFATGEFATGEPGAGEFAAGGPGSEEFAAHAPVDAGPAPASGRLAAYDPRVMGLVARLAEVIARPIGRSDLGAHDFAPLDADRIAAAAAASPSFARPLNALVARRAGFLSLEMSQGLIDRLGARPASRLAALLATATQETLRETAGRVAAAALHPRVVLMPHKAQRMTLIAAMGEENYRLATREAPLRYPRLGDFAAAVSEDFFDVEADRLRESIAGFGLSIVFAFLDACERELALLTRRRWPTLDRPAAGAVALGDVHRELFLRLCVRSYPSWSPIIA